MVADSALPLISALLVGVAAVLGAVFTAVAARATRIAKAAELKVSAVDVSLDSLRQALERADAENKTLRSDLFDVREECRRCDERVLKLTQRIKVLEGRP